jgi:hypothetical protein
VLWRLFQCLEKRIEGACRQHVHFIDDVNLTAPVGWQEFNGFANFTNLFNAIIASTIDLKYIDRSAPNDLATR